MAGVVSSVVLAVVDALADAVVVVLGEVDVCVAVLEHPTRMSVETAAAAETVVIRRMKKGPSYRPSVLVNGRT